LTVWIIVYLLIGVCLAAMYNNYVVDNEGHGPPVPMVVATIFMWPLILILGLIIGARK
jgi:hypothetical protein